MLLALYAIIIVAMAMLVMWLDAQDIKLVLCVLLGLTKLPKSICQIT